MFVDAKRGCTPGGQPAPKECASLSGSPLFSPRYKAAKRLWEEGRTGCSPQDGY